MMTEVQQDPSITNLELERYLLGELDLDRSAAVERAAQTDAALRSWLEERRSEQRAFRDDPHRRPFRALVEEAGAAKAARRPFFTTWRSWCGFFGAVPRVWTRAGFPRVWMLAGAGALATILGAVVLVPHGAEDPRGSSTIAVRGGLSVKAAVLHGGRSELFDGRRPLNPGDQLRLTVDDPLGGYLTVLLEEESGDVSVAYSPAELGHVSPGSHVLPGSLKLDDVLGRERLYVIMSAAEPEPGEWLRELRAAGTTAHGGHSFLHGWLPAGPTRIGIVEYQKVAPK